MKLVFEPMERVLRFEDGYVTELVVENRRMFWELVESMVRQAEGESGKCLLSVSDKPVEFSRYADLTMQFAPFEVNRKSLLTKLCAALERNAVAAEFYLRSGQILADLEVLLQDISADLPFEIDCKKMAIGPILRAVGPEIAEQDTGAVERIFSYMELVRELDRDRLFIMVNMRTYFSDADMEIFIESACLHGFRVLLVESVSFAPLKNVKRYTVDEDLCEF